MTTSTVRLLDAQHQEPARRRDRPAAGSAMPTLEFQIRRSVLWLFSHFVCRRYHFAPRSGIPLHKGRLTGQCTGSPTGTGSQCKRRLSPWSKGFDRTWRSSRPRRMIAIHGHHVRRWHGHVRRWHEGKEDCRLGACAIFARFVQSSKRAKWWDARIHSPVRGTVSQHQDGAGADHDHPQCALRPFVAQPFFLFPFALKRSAPVRGPTLFPFALKRSACAWPNPFFIFLLP